MAAVLPRSGMAQRAERRLWLSLPDRLNLVFRPLNVTGETAKGNQHTEQLLKDRGSVGFLFVSIAPSPSPGSAWRFGDSLWVREMRKVSALRPLKRQLQLLSGLNTADVRAEG